MQLSTSSTIHGAKKVKHVGLVTAEVVLGMHIGKDFMASFRDTFGGRSSSYESEMKKANDHAIQDLIDEAQKLGADAIVDIRVDHDTIGSSNTMLMVSAMGTAVKIED